MPQTTATTDRFLLLLDELERFELPHRIRRDPLPPKTPTNPRLKLRYGDMLAVVNLAAVVKCQVSDPR